MGTECLQQTQGLGLATEKKRDYVHVEYSVKRPLLHLPVYACMWVTKSTLVYIRMYMYVHAVLTLHVSVHVYTSTYIYVGKSSLCKAQVIMMVDSEGSTKL